ncbi:ribosomal-protein-alanine N-acetyltransferase [Raoultella planticola]|uniref:Ribosomal-protein-alanine N-acetyltransferase n=1 Tax=Raoultella planticola TaxID=575 RepID=A0A485B3C0_RAOPL|nr:ribosomal-protein-alanine N-acetyltransferase [Raoultella planticola]
MELTAVSATQFSVAQLTTILSDCFEDYLVPVSLPLAVFVQRFSSEGLSLLDSCVWLDGETPAAIAIVARRGDEARLAAFAVRPAWRGKGMGRRLMTPLMTSLREQGVRRMWLEVIRENYAAVALYQSLGFVVHHGLCGFVSTRAEDAAAAVLEEGDVLPLLRRAGAEINGRLPWLDGPVYLRYAAMPDAHSESAGFCGAGNLNLHAAATVFVVEPSVRGRGLAHEMLRALARQFPGLSTSVIIPNHLRRCLARRGMRPWR